MRLDSAASRGGPGSVVGIDEESIVGRLGGSQSHYNELRERRKQEYLGYLEQEIRLKRALKEVESDKTKQRDMQLEEKLRIEREIEARRLQEEKMRDLEIDYTSIEQNRKKFDTLFQQDGAAEDILDKFAKEDVFGNKKPAAPPANIQMPGLRKQASFGPEDYNDPPPRGKGSQAEFDESFKQQTNQIRKLQSENLRYQMEAENELRPQVNSSAQIQGYGMNRFRKPSAGEPMGLRDVEFEQQAALGRWDQNTRERYALQDRQNPLPFLPTAKEILANQVTRDVKDEMLRMRGNILTSMDKMRRDMEKIKSDAIKSDTRFKYAQKSYQDQLQREMAQRDDMVVDILDGVRGWKPGGIAYASRNGIREITIEKAPEWRIPALDFTEVTRELKEKLDALKGITPARNPDSLMIQKQGGLVGRPSGQQDAVSNDHLGAGRSSPAQPATTQFNQYISPERLQDFNARVNPESRFIAQALEQERKRVQQDRGGVGPTRRTDNLTSIVDSKRSLGGLAQGAANVGSQNKVSSLKGIDDPLLSSERPEPNQNMQDLKTQGKSGAAIDDPPSPRGEEEELVDFSQEGDLEQGIDDQSVQEEVMA